MLSFVQYLTEYTNSVSVNVYHGSGRSFRKFEQRHARIANDHFGGGIGYFTDNHEVAKTYARSMARRPDATAPHVYHTTLNMNNVFDVDHEFSGEKLKNLLPDNPDHHEQFARAAGLLTLGGDDKYTVLNKLRNGNLSLSGAQVFKGLSKGNVDTAKTRQHLISKGYDGIRYNGGENMNMETRHNVYIPYNANSITIKKVTKI
jgi:hypothetical protein